MNNQINTSFKSLIESIKAAGVIITEEAKLFAMLETSKYSPQEYLPLVAQTGRRDGITFCLNDASQLNKIHSLLIKYELSQEDATVFTSNVRLSNRKSPAKIVKNTNAHFLLAQTKSEKIISTFTDADYIAFNELHSRIIFTDQDLSVRQSREEVVKFAVKFTTSVVKSIVGSDSGGLFVSGEPDELMNRVQDKFEAPFSDYGSLVTEAALSHSSMAALNKAIDFALDKAGTEGLTFLREWREGNYEAIAREFPEFGLNAGESNV